MDIARPRKAISIVGMFGLLLLYYLPNVGTAYTSDSFGYYLLGKSLVEGQGYVAHAVRDVFVVQPIPAPGAAWPPFVPLLIGLFDAVFHLGIASGVLMNLTWLAVIVALLHTSPHDRIPLAWKLIVCLAFCTLNTGFRGEVAAGRSIPTTVALYLMLAHLLCGVTSLSRKRALLVGAVAGCTALCRFDSLGASVATLLATTFSKETRREPGALLSMAGGALAVYGPWLIQCALAPRFGVSSNMIGAWSVANGGTYPFSKVEWLRDAPILWLTQRLEYLGHNLTMLLFAPCNLGAALLFVFCLRRFGSQATRATRQFSLMAVFYAFFATATLSLMPFYEARYQSAPVFLLILASASLCHPLHAPLARVSRALSVAIGATVLVASIWRLTDRWPHYGLTYCGGDCLEASASAAAFSAHVPAGSRVASLDAEALHYTTQWDTLVLPYEISPPALAAWLADWQVTHVVASEANLSRITVPMTITASSLNMRLAELNPR